MAIGSVPPRGGMPPTTVVDPAAAKQAEAAKQPETPKKPEGPKDELTRGQAGPKGPGAPATAALPKGEVANDVGGQLEAFMTLAGQVGELPDGARVAAQFEMNLPGLDRGPGVASLGFTSDQIAATADLMALLKDGLIDMPADVAIALTEKYALMTAPLPTGSLEAVLQKLPEAERAAFEKLARELGPAFSGMAKKPGAGRKKDLLKALRGMKGLKLRSLHDLDDIEPDELRDLVRRALGRGQPQEEEPQAQEEAAPDDEKTVKKALTLEEREALLASELEQISTLHDVVLPPLDLAAIERAFAEALPLLKGVAVDDDTLAEMLLVQCGVGGEAEFGALLDDVKRTNDGQTKLREKKRMHERLCAEARSELRRRYDDRARLDKAHPSAIDAKAVSFDAYCDEQKLWLASGSLAEPGGVKVVLRLSPREAFNKQTPNVAVAEVSIADVEAHVSHTADALHAGEAQLEALAERVEFYLERRETFTQMVRAMVAQASARG